MHIRAIITLAIALIMGGITVFLINHYLQQEVSSRAASKILHTVPVVVAAVDIKTGTRLDKMHLKIVDWPEKTVPTGSYTTIETVLGDKPPIILTEVRIGEPVLPYKLSSHGARGGLPARIPENWRAITVPVNEVTGVAGFITPGDFVDVLHTTTVGQNDELPVTRVLLQNIEVLGIDQIFSQADTEPKVVNAVTMLVSLYDTQRLTLALKIGSLNLVLRNEFDASILEPNTVTHKEVLKSEDVKIEVEREVKVFKRATRLPKAQKTAVTPPRTNVEVIRGLEVTTQNVGKDDSSKKDNKEEEPVKTNTP